MTTLGRQCSRSLLLCCLVLAGCGTKPGGPDDSEHLLTGRWQFETLASPLFQPTRMLTAQTEQDSRFLLEGGLFGTHFQRIATSPPAPEAFLFQITFTHLEQAEQYEVLTLSLDGRLIGVDRVEGTYEIRGNLASGGELRLEQGTFAAYREKPATPGHSS